MLTILPVLHVMGMMLLFFGVTYLMPIASSLIYRDGTTGQFLDALFVCLACGAVLVLATRRFKRELKPRDGFLLVTLAWVMMAAIATVPLMLTISGLSFTDAFFETMSGLTTTGSTVLSGLDKLPPSVNLWRHELNWLGGMGIIVLAVAITVACIGSLKVAGMNWLDAICHAFAALSLGGFSTYDDSVGHFNSPLIEGILIFFMMVAGMNFATHFLAWRGRSVLAYWRDPEAKAFVALIASSIVVCSLYLWQAGTYQDLETAFRHVAFNLVSIATDCGFASVDYDKWPIFVPLWMLFLSAVSVSSGSTGGGIKMIRSLILGRQSLRELQKLIHPSAVNPIRIGGQSIPPDVSSAVMGFIFLYVLTVGELSFFLMASGLDFVSSFTAIVASINNAGPGLNVVGPAQNYASLSDFQTWICSLAMLVGRLEIFSVVILFTPYFWRR
jgi:trk system potassium uptake protein TrkH